MALNVFRTQLWVLLTRFWVQRGRLALWFLVQTNQFKCPAKWNEIPKWQKGCDCWATVLIGPCGHSQKSSQATVPAWAVVNHTTLWGYWHQLHCAYWQRSPSGKTTQGHRGWFWIRASYRAGQFLELTWLTGPLNCPNMRFSPKEALESQKKFQEHVWWSLGFLMVIVVIEFKTMNILEMQ